MILLLLIAVFAVSFFVTYGIRRYALAKQLMDIPNARSSHSVPTPRGGGVGFVIAFMLALPCLVGHGVVDVRIAIAVGVPCCLVAVLGFIDDHGHVPAKWRLLGHFVASVIGLLLLNGLPPVQIAGRVLDLGWLGNVLAVFYLVWMLNLFNFMDGIDGLAATEAIFILLGISVLFIFVGDFYVLWLPIVLAVSLTGFLAWNFPPARIFMGDAGSGTLGVLVGFMSIVAANVGPQLLWGTLILAGVFVVDATYTLVYRVLQGAKVYQAHRSHTYQIVARASGSHGKVVMWAAFINFFWLLPLAVWVGVYSGEGFIGLSIAYAPLIGLSVYFKAGVMEAERNGFGSHVDD